MDGVIQDIRHAARALRRSWLVTFLAAASLALAIAGNTTSFSLEEVSRCHVHTDRIQQSSIDGWSTWFVPSYSAGGM